MVQVKGSDMETVEAGDLDIGEVSQRTGVQPSALRFYERRGLIRSSGRAGLRRRYRPDVLDRLALIATAQAAGFTLAEIADLFATSSDSALRQRLEAKADDLDHRITQLAGMRDALRHATACPHAHLLDCPTFWHAVHARGCP